MNKETFRRSCDKIVGAAGKSTGGIGTLGEKTLHSVLKNYCEPDETCHEIKVGNFVADILTDSGIIEIQTRQFHKMRRKLDFFLEQSDVTIVYPIARIKWLLWIDETTGEITSKRKSPKTGKVYEAFHELYQIKNQLCHPRLHVRLVLLDLEEYRYLNGWSENKKRGSSRYDRIPVDIAEELLISCPEDYAKLIPAALGAQFTSKDFKAASGLRLPAAQTALNVLYAVGAVKRTGKSGNAYIYERVEL